MTYVHLQERAFYEDIYDRHTVEDARRGMIHYEKFYAELEAKLNKDDKLDRPGNVVLLNAFYMQTVGLELIERYENREQYIVDWMAKDEAKDNRISAARLSEEPYCHYCGKQGLRITDKSLMHRNNGVKYDDPLDILFILHCPHCDKNSGFWEDGTVWKTKPTVCPKCQSEVTHKYTKTKKILTITYTCTACKHSFEEKMDISTKQEKPDPDFDKDRTHYCLWDKEFREHLFATKKGFEGMAKFGKKMKEKEDNKDLYDAVKKIKKPRIAELSTILAPVLGKAGYIEFSLEKPEIGKDVFIAFSCLDSKTDRGDYDSENTLKKIIEKALVDTNWRLMSEGIHYRLGYLSGRLRAYEREEDLKKLVEKSNLKNGKDNERSMDDGKGRKIIF